MLDKLKLFTNANAQGMHAFEAAGLGVAPFEFVGVLHNEGSSCDYCGTRISLECWIKGAGGGQFKVGSDCIRRIGDAALAEAHRWDHGRLAHVAALRERREGAAKAALRAWIEENRPALALLPHSRGHKHWRTREPLTLLDEILHGLIYESAPKVRELAKWAQARLASETEKNARFFPGQNAMGCTAGPDNG